MKVPYVRYTFCILVFFMSSSYSFEEDDTKLDEELRLKSVIAEILNPERVDIWRAKNTGSQLHTNWAYLQAII